MSLANQIQDMDEFTHNRLNRLVTVMVFEDVHEYLAFCRRHDITPDEEQLAREIVAVARLEERAHEFARPWNRLGRMTA